MYNSEVKQRYIEEKESSVIMSNNYLACQFGKCEYYENLVNKDVSNFTTYEIVDYYKTLNISSIESLVVMNSQFAMYVQWCIQQNLVVDCQNHFLEITKEVLMSCINKIAFEKSIVSRETVLGWCDEVINPRDALIILCLFEGIKGKDFCEIVRLKMSDFNGNKVKLCTGREIIVSNKLIELAKESYDAIEYYSVTATQSKKMPLIDVDGSVLKGYPNQRTDVSDFQRGRVVYNSCTRSMNFLGVIDYISANALTESGKLYFIKKRASELDITPREYIYSNYVKEVENQYGFNLIKSNYCSKYSEYMG